LAKAYRKLSAGASASAALADGPGPLLIIRKIESMARETERLRQENRVLKEERETREYNP
jgi:hypothetical protein